MLDTLQRAERCILLGKLSEAHGLFQALSVEVAGALAGGGPLQSEVVAAFRRFKATVAKCRQRDQMLATIYAGARQEPYRG